jgi:filamentous hemagglutinin
VLSPEGSRISGGRYNKLGEGVIYLACDTYTCLEETTRASRNDAFTVAQKKLPRTMVGIEVKLSNVLYLTDRRILRTIGITKTILTTTDWDTEQKNGRVAITQKIGWLAKENGFEAILVPSAAKRNGKNLVIFPENIQASSTCLVIQSEDLPKTRIEFT